MHLLQTPRIRGNGLLRFLGYVGFKLTSGSGLELPGLDQSRAAGRGSVLDAGAEGIGAAAARGGPPADRGEGHPSRMREWAGPREGRIGGRVVRRGAPAPLRPPGPPPLILVTVAVTSAGPCRRSHGRRRDLIRVTVARSRVSACLRCPPALARPPGASATSAAAALATRWTVTRGHAGPVRRPAAGGC
jgi:hypothetical protein